MTEGVFAALLVGQFGIVFIAGFVALGLARRIAGEDLVAVVGMAFVGLGLLAFGAFWLAWVSFRSFEIAKIIFLASGSIAFVLLIRQRETWRSLAPLAEPAAYMGLLALLVLAWGFAAGGIDQPERVSASRFSHDLPPDNILPLAFANALRTGHVASPFFGDWLSSDRPPLQVGFCLLLGLPTGHRAQSYQVLATLLQASFVFAVWAVCKAMALPDLARRLVLATVVVLPVTLVNTLFTWPKMLPVGYLMLFGAYLFARSDTEVRSVALDGAIAGAAAALATLAHGTSFFALIGFVLACLMLRRLRGPVFVLVGSAVSVATYVPWILYQRFVDPPGDRLLKLHIAGVVEIDSRSFGQTLVESYQGLTLADWLTAKWMNLLVYVGSFPRNFARVGAALVRLDSRAIDAMRVSDFFNLLPSLHLLSLALGLSLILAAIHRPQDAPDHFRAVYAPMLATAAAILAMFALLMFLPGSAVNHVGTYLTPIVIATMVIAHLALIAPCATSGLVAVQAGIVAMIYFVLDPKPIVHWGLAAAAAVAAASLFGVTAVGIGPRADKDPTRP